MTYIKNSGDSIQKMNKWIPINKLPKKDMKVQWKCEDGIVDVGFYNSKLQEFLSYDLLSEKQITHWKRFIPICF